MFSDRAFVFPAEPEFDGAPIASPIERACVPVVLWLSLLSALLLVIGRL